MIHRTPINWPAKLLLMLAMPLLSGACSALQPPDAGGEKPSRPQYPLMLPVDSVRLEETVVMWERLTQSLTNPQRAQVRLHPFTATIESLPPNARLYLPKVGVAPTMSEEETRESLRKFVKDWQGLIGADPSQLSLVERKDDPDGSKLARYEQHPFRYPLRGSYGSLRIRFAADRRITEFSSTCLPNADRLQSGVAAMNAQLSWEDATSRVSNLVVNYTTAVSQQSTYQLSASNQPEVRDLVVYAREPSVPSDPLELYLAWEIAVTGAPFKLIYLDAVKGDIIATARV